MLPVVVIARCLVKYESTFSSIDALEANIVENDNALFCSREQSKDELFYLQDGMRIPEMSNDK